MQAAPLPRRLSKGQVAAKPRPTATRAVVPISESDRVADLPLSHPGYREDIRPALAVADYQSRQKVNLVVAALAEIAFADIREVLDDEGRILPLDEIPPYTRRAIAEYKVRQRTRIRTGHNGEKVTETVELVSVRFHSKLAALAALGRYLGMW